MRKQGNEWIVLRKEFNSLVRSVCRRGDLLRTVLWEAWVYIPGAYTRIKQVWAAGFIVLFCTAVASTVIWWGQVPGFVGFALVNLVFLLWGALTVNVLYWWARKPLKVVGAMQRQIKTERYAALWCELLRKAGHDDLSRNDVIDSTFGTMEVQLKTSDGSMVLKIRDPFLSVERLVCSEKSLPARREGETYFEESRDRWTETFFQHMRWCENNNVPASYRKLYLRDPAPARVLILEAVKVGLGVETFLAVWESKIPSEEWVNYVGYPVEWVEMFRTDFQET